MAFRFHRSFKIAPGIRLNVSKSGLGVSAGVRGARVGVNSRGTYTTVGIPGTGISETTYHATTKQKGTLQAPTKKGSGLGWVIAVSVFFLFVNPVVAVIVFLVGFFLIKYKAKREVASASPSAGTPEKDPTGHS